MIVRAAITSSSQPPDLIDDERVQRESWCALSLLHVYWLHTAWCIHDTGPVYAGYVYLTGYWQPPDTQSRTHTRMPFLISQLSKSYWASDWSVCARSWPLIGWCWTQPGPGSRQWVIISAFGLDLAAMPNINRIYRLVQAEEWNITIVFYWVCGPALSARCSLNGSVTPGSNPGPLIGQWARILDSHWLIS